ncbi:arsenate reductase (glutaredoxin) [Aureisphaera sp. CAU 1614]|uniref:Arsenate reductase (Glutaredoxin) n=1 Tax=Halomarinibacterium sedimenti TaxID=2857106 RepID=A0A9X1JXE5_9FLAO|nr:arsenate reductase (glutaredoxin) [Halomarinibacterium sedimenti]MBW2938043.1 arsenate reductase (glutaredoxin) [Halomarinibacterium sedimenti]
MTTIYHNPRCSKSREALQILEAHNEAVEIIHYLDTPPTVEELQSLLTLLHKKPKDIVRKNETLWKEKYRDKKLSGKRLLKILAKNPQLIERPIVIKKDKAIVARPPESVKEIL